MDDIDYGAVFGITPTGEEVTEVADPSTDADTAQGEKEQEVADPAANEQSETDGGDAAAHDDDDSQTEGAEQTPDKTDKNARYAAARRKAEAERDAAVAKAKEEAQAEAQRIIDEAFKASGLTNPYTKQPITNKAEYDEYKQRFEAEKKSRLLKKAGMSDEEFNAFVSELPEVRQAKEQAAAAEAERAKVKVNEQLKEIAAIDPTIKELADIAKMDTYPRFYELVKKGNSLSDAFKLANLDKLTATTAEASRQAAVNAVTGKGHLTRTATRGAGAVSVPQDVRAEYLAFNPGATDAEIAAHYNSYIKK